MQNQSDSTLNAVKHIIAVSSAKGGVGKSTVAANLACALQQTGAKVALLDADIYGPSVPTLFGTQHLDAASTPEILHPVMSHGVALMSIGFLIDPAEAVAWRAPMVVRALQQLLFQTQWGEQDYLIIDMPPGTGDVALSLAQNLPITAALIVTTPQKLAYADVERGMALFDKVKIPVLGVVENMAYFECDACDKQHALYPEYANKQAIEILARMPLLPALATASDNGTPYVIQALQSPLGLQFQALGSQVAEAIAQYHKKNPFPKIVVEIE